MFQSLKNLINFKKSLGFPKIGFPHPLIIFESDDWGCIRMPSKITKEKLSKINPEWVNDPYLQYDSLESEDDLELLFNLLSEHKDYDGRNPVITANCIGMNPDFCRIKENHYSNFFCEDFRDSFSQNAKTEQSFVIEKRGFDAGLFFPQFHGREHVHLSRWLSGLNGQNRLLKVAFENRMISLKNNTRNNCIEYYMDAMNPFSSINLGEIIEITKQGLTQFKSVWGFDATSMIAPCYLWHSDMESHCHQMGIKIFQGIKYQFSSKINHNPGEYSKVFHYPGEQNNGLFYNVRNAFFEPSLNAHRDWVHTCLSDIMRAVKRFGYATVSIHRLNFMGSIEPDNREKTLRLFAELLKGIKKVFPTVRYISTPELLSYWNIKSDA
jgi:hypothetical protein